MQGDIGDLYVRTTQTVSGRAGPLSRRSCPDTLTHYFCIAGHDCCLETFPENPRARKQPASPEINKCRNNEQRDAYHQPLCSPPTRPQTYSAPALLPTPAAAGLPNSVVLLPAGEPSTTPFDIIAFVSPLCYLSTTTKDNVSS